MKIVIIHSSGRRNGNTERLTASLEGQIYRCAKENGVPVEIHRLALFDENIQLCRGCRVCFDKGEAYCSLHDSFLHLRDELSEADGVVLASPVYVEDVNGTMKNWIDRMAFVCHRPAFFHQCAVAITTSGSGSTSHSLNTMKNALSAWGFHVSSMQKFRMGARMDDKEIEKRFADKLYEIASGLVQSILRHDCEKPSLFSLLAFRIQQDYYRKRQDAGGIDRKYWQQAGWLDSHVHYYIPIRTNRAKLLLSAFLGRVVARFFV